MLGRSLLLAAFASALVACSFDTPAPPPETSSANQTGKNKKTSPVESADRPAPGEVNNQDAIDGTWDITTSSAGFGPSSLTISNGKIKGALVSDDENVADGDCIIRKNRVSYDLTINGDSMSGTLTQELEYDTSSECSGYKRLSKVTATRAHADANGDAPTMAEGDWTVVAEGAPAFAVSVAGLLAKTYATSKTSGSPVITTMVAGSDATIAASQVSFAARKR